MEGFVSSRRELYVMNGMEESSVAIAAREKKKFTRFREKTDPAVGDILLFPFYPSPWKDPES